MIDAICKACGKHFRTYPSAVKKGRKYCSLKCRPPVWNKGKTGIYSEETRRRISQSLSGRKLSEERKKKSSLPGEKNPRWKGGKSEKEGYVIVYAPEHPRAYNNKVYEHRLVMEKHLGRYLEPNEHVHHKNGNGKDNDIENLVLLTNSEHQKQHPRKRNEKSGRWLSGSS